MQNTIRQVDAWILVRVFEPLVGAWRGLTGRTGLTISAVLLACAGLGLIALGREQAWLGYFLRALLWFCGFGFLVWAILDLHKESRSPKKPDRYAFKPEENLAWPICRMILLGVAPVSLVWISESGGLALVCFSWGFALALYFRRCERPKS